MNNLNTNELKDIFLEVANKMPKSKDHQSTNGEGKKSSQNRSKVSDYDFWQQISELGVDLEK